MKMRSLLLTLNLSPLLCRRTVGPLSAGTLAALSVKGHLEPQAHSWAVGGASMHPPSLPPIPCVSELGD